MQIKMLTSNLEEVIEDRELIRREAKEQVEAVNEQMNMTHQKIEGALARSLPPSACAVDLRARLETCLRPYADSVLISEGSQPARAVVLPFAKQWDFLVLSGVCINTG